MVSERKLGKPAWLLFILILTLQGQQAAVRMRVWRALKALGTAVLRDGVYVLPNRDEFLEPLQAQAEEITAAGGSAQILEVEARDELQEIEFLQLFDRTPDYEKLLEEIRRASKGIGKTQAAVLSSSLTRLWHDYETIALQDFFPGAAREQTRDALESRWPRPPMWCFRPTSLTRSPALFQGALFDSAHKGQDIFYSLPVILQR